MNKLKLIIPFFILIFSNTIYGQYSDFDLSKYKLPDIKTDRLDLNLLMNHSMNNDLIQVTNSDTIKSATKNLNGSLNLYYYHFRNSDRYQGNYTVNLGIDPGFRSNKRNELVTRDNNIYGIFSIGSTNRFYNQNLFFIEVDPGMSFNLTTNRHYQDLSSTSSSDENSTVSTGNLSVPFSIGYGRIEPVEDARLAVYILEELNKAGKISDLPPENIILELAKEISKIKRKRFFDTRIKKIEELQVIDSFLVANNIVTSNDIRYFAVLNDQWDYASGPLRESGFAINTGVDNNMTLNKSHDETVFNSDQPIKSKSSINDYMIGGFLRIKYAKPVNLYWQTSVLLETNYNIDFTTNPEDRNNSVDNYKTNIFNTGFSYSLQYLPDSRTSIELSLGGSYQYSEGKRSINNIDPINSQINSNILTLSPGIDMYYYISPQLRVQFNSFFNLLSSLSSTKYENTYADEKTKWNLYNHNISVRLIYSFF